MEPREVPDAQLLTLTHCVCGSRLGATAVEMAITPTVGRPFSASIPAKVCSCGETFVMAEALHALRD